MLVTPIDNTLVSTIIQPRKKYSHKGDYGHGAIVAGSRGMMGAAVLSARAFLRAGGGKLTVHIPDCGYDIIQTSVPEAMCRIAGKDWIEIINDVDQYDTIGIGPGLAQPGSHLTLLSGVFETFQKPMVIDADALNMIGKHAWLLDKIPAHSILTPHAAEFDRIFGPHNDNEKRKITAIEVARRYNLIIVCKGPETFISSPDGDAYTNTTGNPGMATGGTGDVLTGIITGLLAQLSNPVQSAIAGVYLHGLAGDMAANIWSEHSMIASDLIDCLGEAFRALRS